MSEVWKGERDMVGVEVAERQQPCTRRATRGRRGSERPSTISISSLVHSRWLIGALSTTLLLDPLLLLLSLSLCSMASSSGATSHTEGEETIAERVSLERKALLDWSLFEDFDIESTDSYEREFFASSDEADSRSLLSDAHACQRECSLAIALVASLATAAKADWQCTKSEEQELESCGGGAGLAYQREWHNAATGARLACYVWARDNLLLMALDCPDREFALVVANYEDAVFVRTRHWAIDASSNSPAHRDAQAIGVGLEEPEPLAVLAAMSAVLAALGRDGN